MADELSGTDNEEENESGNTKANSVVKIICAAVAAVLAVVVAIFAWNSFFAGKIITLGFDADDVEGTYADSLYGETLTFELNKGEIKIPAQGSDFMVDSSASSDAGDETVLEYDGTFKTGFTEKYIQDILIQQYIISNNLTEKYQDYCKDNDLLVNDFKSFAIENNITLSQLDEIDKERGVSESIRGYSTTGYWKYNKDKKQINIYGEDGNIMGEFLVKRDGIIPVTSFYEKDGNKYTMKYEAYGVTEVISVDEDNKCSITVTESNSAEPRVKEGTYKTKDGLTLYQFDQDASVFKKVSGGIAMYVFEKQ